MAERLLWRRKLPSRPQYTSGYSVETAARYLTRWGAVIGGNIALWRAIGGVWRAEADETENYTYAIALLND